MTKLRYSQILGLTAATLTLILAGCVNPALKSQSSNAYPDEATTATSNAAPTYYRGTTNSPVPTNNDASINANVVAAVSAVPRMPNTSIQVSTYNGVVSLNGTAESQLVAQNVVQAARQVPGVQSVNYNIRVLN